MRGLSLRLPWTGITCRNLANNFNASFRFSFMIWSNLCASAWLRCLLGMSCVSTWNRIGCQFADRYRLFCVSVLFTCSLSLLLCLSFPLHTKKYTWDNIRHRRTWDNSIQTPTDRQIRTPMDMYLQRLWSLKRMIEIRLVRNNSGHLIFSHELVVLALVRMHGASKEETQKYVRSHKSQSTSSFATYGTIFWAKS